MGVWSTGECPDEGGEGARRDTADATKLASLRRANSFQKTGVSRESSPPKSGKNRPASRGELSIHDYVCRDLYYWLRIWCAVNSPLCRDFGRTEEPSFSGGEVPISTIIRPDGERNFMAPRTHVRVDVFEPFVEFYFPSSFFSGNFAGSNPSVRYSEAGASTFRSGMGIICCGETWAEAS